MNIDGCLAHCFAFPLIVRRLSVQQLSSSEAKCREPPNTAQDNTALDTMAGSRGAETWQQRGHNTWDAEVQHANERVQE